MNHLKLNRYSHLLQANLPRLQVICFNWYQAFAPDKFKYRKNVKQCQLSDITILALLLWQTELGIESQNRFYQTCIQGSFNLSRSRFNRRARQLLPLIYLIRRELNQEVNLTGRYLIVDSFPVPLCQPVRNFRIKIFQGYADIGYKATKKIYYYGFKAHFLVSDDGYLLGYAITKASVHDAKELPELVANVKPQNRLILGDEGYLGQRLHDQLKHWGYELWTPWRHNMKGAKEHNDQLLMNDRRTIESDFALLVQYNAENNRARSLTGLQERLELAVLVSNIEYCLERYGQSN